MGRNKRKPKLHVIREPNGRLSRADYEMEFSPTAIKRLAHASAARMENSRWGTELGRLFLSGKISVIAMSAGERWARTATAYYQAIDAPKPNPKALSLERGIRAMMVDPESTEGRRVALLDREAVHDMLEAHAVLTAAGKLAEASVRAVCERGETAAGWEIASLERGLRWLADFWEIGR